MRWRLAVSAALCFVLLATSALLFAQVKVEKAPKAAKGKMSNIQGKVGKIDKDTITVLVGTTPKPVMIGSDTKFLMGHSNDNKPGSAGDVKQGNFIACSGTMDAKSQFMAKQCVYRDKQ